MITGDVPLNHFTFTGSYMLIIQLYFSYIFLSTVCPYKLPVNVWMDDPTQWPPLSYKDLYHYLIKTPGVYSQEKIENYKALQAHKYLLSGWVQNVVHVILSSGNVLLMCDVRPSYCTSDKPHKPWIGLSESGYVTAGHRTCMAGYVFLKKYIIYLSISFYKTHDHLLD